MKQASDEPTTSTGKRARSRLFTVQQVMKTLANSDSDEAESDQDYALSSDTDTESENPVPVTMRIDLDLVAVGQQHLDLDLEGGVSHKQLIQGMVSWMTVGVETL